MPHLVLFIRQQMCLAHIQQHFDEHSPRSDRYVALLPCFPLMSFPCTHVHNLASASTLILLVFFLQMATLNFKHILDSLQSPESLPLDMMTSYKALHFRDIHFALQQHTLNMQWVSLIYLKSLVNDNSFQPEGFKPNAYSSTTAILMVFLFNEQHQGIEHVHISLVVCHKECHLYMQDGILPFMKSIEVDLKKARDRHTQKKDPGGACSYSLLIANYGGIMAVPTDPPYCLVYHTVHNDDVEDQNQFNTATSPSGMCTCSCMCHILLQHADKDPVC